MRHDQAAVRATECSTFRAHVCEHGCEAFSISNQACEDDHHYMYQLVSHVSRRLINPAVRQRSDWIGQVGHLISQAAAGEGLFDLL